MRGTPRPPRSQPSPSNPKVLPLSVALAPSSSGEASREPSGRPPPTLPVGMLDAGDGVHEKGAHL